MPSKDPLSSASGTRSNVRQVLVFALVCVFSGAGVVAYAIHSRQRSLERVGGSAQTLSTDPEQLYKIRQRPHLLFRNTTMGPFYGRLSVASLDPQNGVRYATDMACERVYGAASGGVCLQASRGVFTSYRAVSFSRDFQPQHTFNLPGTPSRTRVSSSAKFGATTVFVKGDSYNSGGFSTRTTLYDLSTAQIIVDLEAFTVTKDGASFHRADFNFWGVTFTPDGDGFFATLGSGAIMYLVEGRVSTRNLRVVREGVECPSLSPDGTKLVFKSRTSEGGRLVWKLHVLSLKTGAEAIIQEARSVDDQAEWLDAGHVLYALPRNAVGSAASDIWVANADGTGSSRLFLADAFSPCVIRP